MSATAQLVTQSEFARRRGVSRQAVHRLIGRGRIPLTKDGLIDVRRAELTLLPPTHRGRPRKPSKK
jgi:predicted DNA-binding protein (UPF0251 family)